MEKEYKLNTENFSCFLLVLCYLSSYIPLRIYGMGADNSKIRYFVLFAITIISIFLFILKYKNNKKSKKNIYGKRLLLLIPVAIIFFIFSVYKAKSVNMPLNFRTYVQISLVVLPAIYSMFLLNFVSTKKIIFIMKIFLIMTIFLYFSEEEHTIFQFFNISNYMQINKDALFTESSLCSETFFQLFAFFNFIRNIKTDSHEEKKTLKNYMIISAIFTLLCNKRMTMLFVVIIFFTNCFFENQKNTKKYLPFIFAVITCVATYYYTLFVQNKLFTNLDIFSITTGRNYIMSLWAKKDFFSYGYGTSMLVIGRYLEMDLVQIYLELNMFCVFLYSYILLKISNRKWYSFVMMGYVILKLWTSVYLPMSFPWIILFSTIIICSDKKLQDENIEIESSKKIKFEVR